MKRLKLLLAFALVLALAVGTFASCALLKPARNDTVTETQVVPEAGSESEPEEPEETASEPASEPESESGKDTVTGTESESASESESETESESAPDSESEGTSVREPEVLELPDAAELEKFLSTPMINGLLTSTYSDVRDASLREVVYQASDEDIPYEIVAEVLEKKQGQELAVGVSYISSEKLQTFLLDRTGRALEEFRCDLSSYYLNDEDLDLYYVQHGDTNMQPVKVLEVGEESGKLVVRYTTSFGSDWFWINEGGKYGSAPEMEVVLTPGGDGYRFVSNQPAN